MSQRQVARELGCDERTVRRVEHGLTAASQLLVRQLALFARRRVERRSYKDKRPIHYVDMERMEYYLGKEPRKHLLGHGQERASWRAHRAIYRRILADVQAGRAVLVPFVRYQNAPAPKPQPVAVLLDQSLDLDLT